MATNENGARTLEGTVAAVNERGLRLEGRAGWLNYSKWAGELTPPQRGQVVALRLDGSGFVRAVGPADNGVAGSHQAPVAGRETAIVRRACLEASAAFCAAGPELKTADLFALADRPRRAARGPGVWGARPRPHRRRAPIPVPMGGGPASWR